MDKGRNLMYIDLKNFQFSNQIYKIPYLHETWTWEGDESVLPYKWAEIIRRSGILEKKGQEFDLDDVKKFLKENYYGLNDFDKLSFFFITYRSQVMACSYFNIKTNTIDYFLINPKGYDKGLENGLFSLLYKRITGLNRDKIYFNLDNTNVNEEYFEKIGFKRDI